MTPAIRDRIGLVFSGFVAGFVAAALLHEIIVWSDTAGRAALLTAILILQLLVIREKVKP